MHSGLLAVLRGWLLHASPWQRLLISLTALLAGVAVIVVLGRPGGAALILFGVLSGAPLRATLRARVARARARLRR